MVECRNRIIASLFGFSFGENKMAKVIVFLFALIPGCFVAFFLSAIVRDNTSLPAGLCLVIGFGLVAWIFNEAFK